MDDWNTTGKYVFAAIFVIIGVVGLIKGRHSYGGWTGDFFDGEGETVLRGWKAHTLNVLVMLCGIAITIGFGWFLLLLVAFLLLRKLIDGLHED